MNKVPTVSDVPYKKYYKGKAAAPVIPSVFAAYKKGDWTISGFFAITGGVGKASFDDGLPMFESAAMAGIFKESVAKYIKTGGQSPIVSRICILLTVRWTKNSIFIPTTWPIIQDHGLAFCLCRWPDELFLRKL